eukprot:11186479-Lingulodinium_polyedra.AAC.1
MPARGPRGDELWFETGGVRQTNRELCDATQAAALVRARPPPRPGCGAPPMEKMPVGSLKK